MTGCLYLPLLITTLFGSIALYRKNRRIAISFITVFVFCMAWRMFSRNQTTRYYSVGIVLGLFASMFLFEFMNRLAKRAKKTNVILSLFILALLSIQVIKVFSGFNNVYIADLQECLRKEQSLSPSTLTLLEDKEFNRLKNDKKEDEEEVGITQSGDVDLTDYYIRNSDYFHGSFIVIAEKTDKLADRKNASVPGGQFIHALTQFNTSREHNRKITLYYHDPYEPSPDIEVDKILDNPVLKAYEPKYDAYIYQVKDKLVWFIGKEITKENLMIYHIFSDDPSLLPGKRAQIGFDNRNFRIGNPCERERIGKYRVFEKEIPSEYPVSYIRTGFNKDDINEWTRNFRISSID